MVAEMHQSTQATWVDVGSLVIQVVGLVAVVIAAVKFFDERKNARETSERDLAWRKTQFIAGLAQSFDSDVRTQRALKLVDRDREAIMRLLLSDSATLDENDLEDLHCLDRYFDFFDRLHTFVFVTKTLGIKEVMAFSGYLDVLEDAELREGVERRGYIDAGVLYDAIQAWVESYIQSGEDLLDRVRAVEQARSGLTAGTPKDS